MTTNFDLLLGRLTEGSLARSLVSLLKDVPRDEWQGNLAELAERMIDEEKAPDRDTDGEATGS